MVPCCFVDVDFSYRGTYYVPPSVLATMRTPDLTTIVIFVVQGYKVRFSALRENSVSWGKGERQKLPSASRTV
jgi:hypothetical protein